MKEEGKVREKALLTDEELRAIVANYATVGFVGIDYKTDGIRIECKEGQPGQR